MERFPKKTSKFETPVVPEGYEPGEVHNVHYIGGPGKFVAYKDGSVVIGPLDMEHIKIDEAHKGAKSSKDDLVGAGTFKCFDEVFDFENQTMSHQEGIFPDRYTSLGFGIDTDNHIMDMVIEKIREYINEQSQEQ